MKCASKKTTFVLLTLLGIRLIPTAQYFPLRFHVLRSMTTLGQATKVFIPLTPYLLEVLNSPEMAKQAKPSTLKPLDWDVHLRAPKQYLGGRVYQVLYCLTKQEPG